MIAECTFFDGGVWAKSPALAAIVETTCFLNVPLDRIDVLSVGTTDEPFTVRKQASFRHSSLEQKASGFIDERTGRGFPETCQIACGRTAIPSLVNVTTSLRQRASLDSPREIERIGSPRKPEAEKPEVLGQIRSRFLNGVFAAPWERFN